jgi:hypothetical protein
MGMGVESLGVLSTFGKAGSNRGGWNIRSSGLGWRWTGLGVLLGL